MPGTIVDLSARSRVIHDSPFNLHYWELTLEEAAAFLRDPRFELSKLGVVLPDGCRIETTIENHDKLSLLLGPDASVGTVVCRGGGHIAEELYRVSLYVSPSRASPAGEKKVLHHRIEQGHHPDRSDAEEARLTSSRLVMLQSPVHLRVHAFLGPLIVVRKFPRTLRAASEDLTKIMEIVAAEVTTNPELKAGMDVLGDWVGRPVPREYAGVYDHVRRSDSTPLKTYLSTVYLRALRTVIGHTCSAEVIQAEAAAILKDLTSLKEQTMERLEKCGPFFVSHLVMEAEARAAEDPDLDEALRFAATRFVTLKPHMAAILPELTQEDRLSFERYNSGDTIQFQSDAVRDWWAIPAHVALVMTLIQDVAIP